MKTILAALTITVALIAGVPAYAATAAHPPVDGNTIALGIAILVIVLACANLLATLLRRISPDAPRRAATQAVAPAATVATDQTPRRRDSEPLMPLIM